MIEAILDKFLDDETPPGAVETDKPEKIEPGQVAFSVQP
jgi:hypothetical protein